MPEFTAHALINAMQVATDDVKRRMALVIEAASTGMAAEHQRAMWRSKGPGTSGPHLADRVVVQRLHEWLHIVRSTSPALHLLELGTREREARTWRGRPLTTPRSTGRITGEARFIPLAVARRTEMLRVAQDLIQDREL